MIVAPSSDGSSPGGSAAGAKPKCASQRESVLVGSAEAYDWGRLGSITVLSGKVGLSFGAVWRPLRTLHIRSVELRLSAGPPFASLRHRSPRAHLGFHSVGDLAEQRVKRGRVDGIGRHDGLNHRVRQAGLAPKVQHRNLASSKPVDSPRGRVYMMLPTGNTPGQY